MCVVDTLHLRCCISSECISRGIVGWKVLNVSSCMKENHKLNDLCIHSNHCWTLKFSMEMQAS